jgi:hypothetical protein
MLACCRAVVRVATRVQAPPLVCLYRPAGSPAGPALPGLSASAPVVAVDDSHSTHTVRLRDKLSTSRVRIVTLSYGAVFNPARAYAIVVKWLSGGLDFDDIRVLYGKAARRAGGAAMVKAPLGTRAPLTSSVGLSPFAGLQRLNAHLGPTCLRELQGLRTRVHGA